MKHTAKTPEKNDLKSSLSEPPVGKPPDAAFPDRLEGIVRSGPFSIASILVPATALLVLTAVIILLVDDSGRTIFFFFLGPFRNIYSLGNMLNMAVPLILGGLGVTVAMKTGSLNLGGEGQVYTGAFVSAAMAISLPPNIFSGFLSVFCGCCAAGIASAFCGYLKAKWNTNELITTFLLSSAIIPVINYLVTGPFLDPQTSLQSTAKIPEVMRLSKILPPSSLSTAILISIVSAFILHVFLEYTKTGYEFRMGGSNELFARYGGINTRLNTVLAMFLSGAFYGLAGSLSVFGTYYSVIKEFGSGLGWNALAVALIGGFSPLSVVPAAVFFAWINSGARIAMQNTGLTSELAVIVQAIIFLLATSRVIRRAFGGKSQ